MDLTMQYLVDYRDLERKLADLAEENAGIRRELERLGKAQRSEQVGQIEQLRADRDRLEKDNLQLKHDLQLWRRRHDDLARE
jgi:predicted nuclease with TOPRIM domain